MGRMSDLSQQLDELDTLHAEAAAARSRLVMEACTRAAGALQRGIRPTNDDVAVLQQAIAQRRQQNRYGQ